MRESLGWHHARFGELRDDFKTHINELLLHLGPHGRRALLALCNAVLTTTDSRACAWLGTGECRALCLTWEDALLRELAAHAERLAPGAFVLSTRRLPSAAFDVLEELTCPMSWGEAVLFVHRRSGDA